MDVDERLLAERGTYYFSGLSMLARLPLEQARRDQSGGQRIGTLISGYPGSPLAGYDLHLQRARALLAGHGVRHLPAGNEEQATTALMGTQMLDDHPHSDYSGVTGFWYGKGPGADRAGDALKHANFAGTSKNGAVVVLSGEDHEAKSSTMPFQQEYGYVSAGMPILYPSSVAEFRTLGLHAVAMSRYSGCWVALKLVANLCDGGETVTVAPDDVVVTIPDLQLEGREFAKRADFSFFPGKNISQEHHLYCERHAAAIAYARANGLNRADGRTDRQRIGIICAGKSAADVRQALLDLGLNYEPSAEGSVPTLTLGMIYPLDEQLVRTFCAGLDEVIVVEEKRPFLEDTVRAALQPLSERTMVVGKSDELGQPQFPVEGGLDSDAVADVLAGRLARYLPSVRTAPRLTELQSVRQRTYRQFEARTPNFCSGCPHSTSTVLAPGQVAFGAPGCACFNTVIEQPERHIDTMTQFGGEALPWIGLAPFIDRPHLVQHVGDGSVYHSSYLNIRWAVATNTRITFKLLWNGVVANTGAQLAPGERGLAALTRGLESEGVARIVICTKSRKHYRRQRLGRGVQVRGADEIVTVAEELATVEGVTVLVYDESCANERRRRIKRGLLPTPNEYLLINEDVCENCGDCGVASNCMSLQKSSTEFGDKTRIHESSCNQDFSCLKGDCPSFATVRTRRGTGYRKPTPPHLELSALVNPAPVVPPTEPYHIQIPGVGGTGVLSVNAMLAFAASFDGRHVISFDQSGAAQKWGPVLSSLILLPPARRDSGIPDDPTAQRAEPTAHANKIGRGRADLYLVLDEVAATSPANLDRCSPERTAAVVNTDLFPTGQMIRDVHHEIDTSAMRAEIAAHTRALIDVPARTIAESLFGDYMMTNLVVVGAAYQAGVLPLRSESIERAIDLNGANVAANTQAFRYGRLWVQDPDRIRHLIEPELRDVAAEREVRAAALAPKSRRAYLAMNAAVDASDLNDEARRLLAIRAAELIAYQSPHWAQRYVIRVLDVHARLREDGRADDHIIEAVARNLFKLMAYKDEYEVARLFLSRSWRQNIDSTFTDPVRIWFNFQPPAARFLGRKKKMRLGPWFVPVLVLLRSCRRLRGTKLDLFGLQSSRREERALIDWYEELLDRAISALRPSTAELVAAIIALPENIRGFESVKSTSIAAARARAEALVEQLDHPPLPVLHQM